MKNYKQLWFNVCEEKKKLELLNITLKKNNDYLSKENTKLERINAELVNSKWQETGRQINSR